MIGKKPWDAANVVRECALFLKDNELMEMLKDAAVRGYGVHVLTQRNLLNSSR